MRFLLPRAKTAADGVLQQEGTTPVFRAGAFLGKQPTGSLGLDNPWLDVGLSKRQQ